MKSNITAWLASAAVATALTVSGAQWGARADTVEIVVDYSTPSLFEAVHAEIAKQFMAAHPAIKVTLRTPTPAYEEAAQLALRQAVTGQLPDVGYHGLNRQRVFVDRNLAVDLGQFIAKEAAWDQQGYDGALMTLGQVKGKQVGMGFSISTPIIYYNATLVKKAGGDPDKLPTTWDGIFELARKVRALGDKTQGFHFDWDITGNWMWQALVAANGGTQLSADETKVAFDGPAGQQAMALLRRMVDEGTMRDVNQDTSLQDFIAGTMGIWAHSTSRLGAATKQIGERFELRTGPFPLPAGAAARLPAGGNVAMMFAKDPAKQAAAWEYIKFATGPIGATIMVKGTGYFPANAKPAKDPALLETFYRDSPNHMTAIKQLPVLTAWYAFPGDNGLKITDVIKDHIQSVINKSAKPEVALTQMAKDVQGLLPR
jgi:multiple sugar transport system substrate-binding protein